MCIKRRKPVSGYGVISGSERGTGHFKDPQS